MTQIAAAPGSNSHQLAAGYSDGAVSVSWGVLCLAVYQQQLSVLRLGLGRDMLCSGWGVGAAWRGKTSLLAA